MGDRLYPDDWPGPSFLAAIAGVFSKWAFVLHIAWPDLTFNDDLGSGRDSEIDGLAFYQFDWLTADYPSGIDFDTPKGIGVAATKTISAPCLSTAISIGLSGIFHHRRKVFGRRCQYAKRSFVMQHVSVHSPV
jgi:hypothetical protein